MKIEAPKAYENESREFGIVGGSFVARRSTGLFRWLHTEGIRYEPDALRVAALNFDISDCARGNNREVGVCRCTTARKIGMARRAFGSGTSVSRMAALAGDATAIDYRTY